MLLAGTVDGDVWMWKVPSGDCKTFQGHGSRSCVGKILPDGNFLVNSKGYVYYVRLYFLHFINRYKWYICMIIKLNFNECECEVSSEGSYNNVYFCISEFISCTFPFCTFCRVHTGC